MPEIEINPLLRYRILAVDDERANLNLLRRTLYRDYDVELAENGPSALEFIKQNSVDMIITDQRMPGMTGIQFLVESLKVRPKSLRMILTAYADIKDIIDSINQAQVYRYILKPWAPDELRITVAKAFEHYRLEQENLRLIAELKKSLEDLKQAQQELVIRERLSAIGRLASTIIHDLKQPVTNIRVSANLLAKDNLESAQRKEISDIIHSEIDRMTNMLQEILDFSRGETRLSMEKFFFNDFLSELVRDLQFDFDSRGIKIERDWGELGEFYGDKTRLRRALLNLIINSRDAMQKGGIIKIIGQKNKNIYIGLEDNGPGFPDIILEKPFEPFVTVGKSNGTGLGMTIAKRIIEAHNGIISAYNKPKGGACVDIILPIPEITNG